MENQEIIEKAYDLVYPLGDTYKTKEDLCYIVIKEEEDDDGEETGTSESFCEDCIGHAIVAYKEKYPDEVKNKIVDYRSYTSSSSERDGFEYCDICGEMFRTALLLDDQELDHWESQETIDIKEPYICYQLMKIFNNSWDYGRQSEASIKKKELRVYNLALRVIDISK